MKHFLVSLLMGVLLSSSVNAQTDNVDRQIIVMFDSKVLELPVGEIKASFDRIKISKELKELFKQFKAEEAKKGFVEFRSEDTVKTLEDGRIFKSPDWSNLFVITLPADVNRDTVIARLAKMEGVLSAEKNEHIILRGDPNDTYFANQWNLKNTGQAGGQVGADINAVNTWTVTTGSNNVKIGIMDSGVDGNHEDLIGRFINPTSYSASHGTNVAGVAAATGNNGKGIAGVDWNVKIYSASVFSSVLDKTALVNGITNSVNAGCKVINMSLGFSDYSSSVFSACRSAYQAGVLLVVANPETGGTGEYPNSFGPWILNVGALSNDGNQSSYSFNRYYTDVAAPGGSGDPNNQASNIYTTFPNNSYNWAAGTSFAAPHITGIASLMLSVNSNLKNYDIEQIIKRTAKRYPNPPTPGVGYGLVNAYEAVRHSIAPYAFVKGTANLTKTQSKIWCSLQNAPGWASGMYYVDVYELKATGTNPGYASGSWGWLSQTGVHYANPFYYQGEYLYENVTATTFEMKTYFYYLIADAYGGIGKWFPSNPNDFVKEYTILGNPPPPLTASISGPTCVGRNQSNTWNAVVSGGTGVYNYQWFADSSPIGTNSPTLTWTIGAYVTLSVTVTSGSQSVSPSQYLTFCDNGIEKSTEQTESALIPDKYVLSQNYPNPFNPTTSIRFGIPEASNVQLKIYNVRGQEIRTLVNNMLSARYYDIPWDGKDDSGNQVSSGVYIYRIEAGKYVESKRMILVK